MLVCQQIKGTSRALSFIFKVVHNNESKSESPDQNLNFFWVFWGRKLDFLFFYYFFYDKISANIKKNTLSGAPTAFNKFL